MNRIAALFMSYLFCCAGTPVCVAQAGTDWPYCRHDLQLTGRSPAIGNMTEALVERWKYYLGGWRNAFVVTFADGHSATLPMFATGRELGHAQVEQPAWKAAPLVDLAGDGKLVQPPPGKIAKLLPEIRGLQQVIWEHPPDGPTRGAGRCYSFEHGADKPRLVWETQEEPEVYELLWTIADMDGDNLPEVVFMTHYRILVYDGQTGKKKSTLQWPIGRNYGQMTLADVDGDKLPEVVVVVDSPPHVDVLKYAPAQGRLLWSHRYVTDAQVSLPIELKLHLIPNHVRDVDGDGQPEILYNLFNADGDFRWHIVVRDALTGNEEYNLAGMFLWGLVDVGRETETLCCLEAPGRGIPECRKGSLVEVRHGNANTLWRGDQVRWQSEPYVWPPTESTIASLGPVAQTMPRTCDVDGDGKNEVFVSRNGQTLQAVGSGRDGRFVVKWSFGAPPDARVTVERTSDKSNAVLVNVDAQPANVELRNCRAEQVSRDSSHSFAPLPARPLAMVADIDGDDQNEIVVQDSRWNTRVFRITPGEKQPRELLRIRGGGLWLGRRWESYPYSKFPIFTADLTRDGKRELLLTDVGDETVSTVACHDAMGQLLWRRPLPDTPAQSIVWMADGNFVEPKRVDLVVVVQNGSIGECFCLRGHDGEILWRMGELKLADGTPFNFGSHAPFLAVADLDGDGLSDLGGQSGQYIALVRGADGRPLVTPRNMIHDLFPRWVNYGVNVVGDWDNSGSLSMFTNTTTNGFGLIDTTLNVKWFTDRDGQPLTQVGAIGRANRDGSWTFGTFAGTTFKTFDMRTGTPLVSEELGGISPVTSQVICADIDGDGNDEFLATASDQLVCVRSVAERGTRLRWKVKLPTIPSELAVADVDNDGLPEIIYTGTDGYLYCLGSQQP